MLSPNEHSMAPLILSSGSPVDSMLRAAILASWEGLVWRHHGIGTLQAYLREHADPEIRVHIWSPRLVRPGIVGHGNAHDHRFNLTSHVLVGGLRDTRYALTADIGGDWSVRTVEHARSAGAGRNFDGEHGSAIYHAFVERNVTEIRAGESYAIRRGGFHSTETTAPLTVTVCAMANKSGTAHILAPRGEEPVHAFGEEFLSPSELLDVAHAAKELVRGASIVRCRHCHGRGCTSPVPSAFNCVCPNCNGSGTWIGGINNGATGAC